jgi:hypothetical protein
MALAEWVRRPPTAKVIPQNLAVDRADSRNLRLREVADSGQFGAVLAEVLVGQPPAQTQIQLVELVEQQDQP